MKKNLRRPLAALLALAAALGLAGCGKDDTAESAFLASPYYLQDDVSLPVDTGRMEGCCTDGKYIWFQVTPWEGSAPLLCRTPLDGGTADVLIDYRPTEWSADADTAVGYLGPIWGGDGKLWVWDQYIDHVYDLPEDFDPEKDDRTAYFSGNAITYRMRQLDPATGKELKAVDVTAAMEQLDLMTFGGMAVDAKGTIYLADDSLIAAADGQGELLFTIETALPKGADYSGAGGSLALTPDGTVAALTILPGEKREARIIDRDAQDFKDRKYALPNGVRSIYGGREPCLFYYVTSDAIYGMVDGEEIPQRLLPWSNAQIDSPSGVKCLALLEEGQAAVFHYTYTASAQDRYLGQLRVIRLSPTDTAPENSRVKLTYGIIGGNPWVSYSIRQFNAESEKYVIELRDYSEGMLSYRENNPQVRDAAAARLFAEVVNGRGPDLFDSSLPLGALGRQGILEDLWPYIDSDPDLGRDAVMEHVLECLETNGKLYRIGSSFAIETAVTSAAVAGNRTGWTVKEMLDAYGGSMPDMYFSGTGSLWTACPTLATFSRLNNKSILRNLVKLNLGSYVDWETGECSFDSEDFKFLLQLSGSGKDLENIWDLNVLESSSYWFESWTSDFFDFTYWDVDTFEPCQVFPWEGDPILCARTLSKPEDLVSDDALFSGKAVGTDYEQSLWDSGIYFWDSGSNDYKVNISTGRFEMDPVQEVFIIKGAHYPYAQPAADMIVGEADGEVYASYVGFPAKSGTGSSFTVYDCAGISAACEAKEGAWSFLRRLLLPGGNELWAEDADVPTVRGFSMNRASFESKLEKDWYVDAGTGEYFLDADGNPIEKTIATLAVGFPESIVKAVYLHGPTQAQLDRFWNLYNAISRITGEDEDLIDIIMEQAEPYFAGDKSLDETADLIQRRASLYVNENR